MIVAARSARAGLAHDREVGHRPARAHRPRQVRREVAGRGQVLGEGVVRRRRPAAASTTPSAPWTGQTRPSRPSRVDRRCAAAGAPRAQGHGSTVRGATARSRGLGHAPGQEFQAQDDRRSPARTPARETVAVSSRKSRPSVTGSPSQRAAERPQAVAVTEHQRPVRLADRSALDHPVEPLARPARRVSPPGRRVRPDRPARIPLADLARRCAPRGRRSPTRPGRRRPRRRRALPGEPSRGPAAAGLVSTRSKASSSSRSRRAAATRRPSAVSGRSVRRGVPAVPAPLGLAVPDQPHLVSHGRHRASRCLRGSPYRGSGRAAAAGSAHRCARAPPSRGR